MLSVKGCLSYGETIDEALENIKEAIELCLEEQEVEPVNKFVGFREDIEISLEEFQALYLEL
jgi:predicted RNase H-like HicB family nuclease